MLVVILGVGLFLSIGLKLMPIMKLGAGFRLMWSGRARGDDDDGDIPPFQALMTALSATVGTGNIAGVATAVFLGGPGALFWMWLTALVGMATKYSEADRKSTRLNSSHVRISYAVFCLKKKT